MSLSITIETKGGLNKIEYYQAWLKGFEYDWSRPKEAWMSLNIIKPNEKSLSMIDLDWKRLEKVPIMDIHFC